MIEIKVKSRSIFSTDTRLVQEHLLLKNMLKKLDKSGMKRIIAVEGRGFEEKIRDV